MVDSHDSLLELNSGQSVITSHSVTTCIIGTNEVEMIGGELVKSWDILPPPTVETIGSRVMSALPPPARVGLLPG